MLNNFILLKGLMRSLPSRIKIICKQQINKLTQIISNKLKSGLFRAVTAREICFIKVQDEQGVLVYKMSSPGNIELTLSKAVLNLKL